MAQNDLWKRYLDAGIQFTQMTQARAEAIVRDLVRAGEVQAEQTQAMVNEMVERSRQNTKRLVETIRKEVRSQIAQAAATRKDMLDRLESQVNDLRAQLAGGARPAKKATTKRPATLPRPSAPCIFWRSSPMKRLMFARALSQRAA